MERELWPPLDRLLREVGKDCHQNNVTYQPWVLVAVPLGAAVHDRTLRWACQRRHWSTTPLKPPCLPSASTLSRRLYSVGVGLLLRALEQRLRSEGDPRLVAFLEGKPLPVSRVSKDKDAKVGRGAGGRAKGYQLHTIWAGRPMPEAWEGTPLNVHETQVASHLLEPLDPTGYLIADGNYDSGPLADQARECGYQWVTPLPANAGQGHRRQSAARLRNLDLLAGAFGKDRYRQRPEIERAFGNASSCAGGLGPLPAWVRRLHRVRTWVWAKLLINDVRLSLKQRLSA